MIPTIIIQIPYPSLRLSQTNSTWAWPWNCIAGFYDNSTALLTVCHNVFVSQSHVLAEGGQVVVFKDTKKIMDCALDRVWKCFLLKVSILRREFLIEGSFQRLESLLQAWLAWRSALNKGGERSSPLSFTATPKGTTTLCSEESSRSSSMIALLRHPEKRGRYTSRALPAVVGRILSE